MCPDIPTETADTALFPGLWREKSRQSPIREYMAGCVIASFTTVYLITFCATSFIISKHMKHYYELEGRGD